jgi:hypothetical protein
MSAISMILPFERRKEGGNDTKVGEKEREKGKG